MALFGRRKPGFSKEVELKPSEIPGEFSDALDPAMNRELDNPKLEKQELQQQAAQVIAQAAGEEEKPELLSYLQSLPEVEDPFPPSPPEEEAPPEPEKTKAQLLADFIRERCKSALITPRQLIAQEEEDLDALLADMAADPTCADILTVKGQKDVYYYSEELMAHNYAKIAMLTLEKDDARTVAEMVRFNCKAFPTPTPVYYFARQPFFLDQNQMALVIAQMKDDPQYQDIRECEAAINGEKYLYSIDLMSEKYAKALANGAESHEADE
ncbi:MAG: hypothetical protein IJ662_00235 [Clostridia bacterium]|nr:hypothetical protein [Clostridia bacterium]